MWVRTKLILFCSGAVFCAQVLASTWALGEDPIWSRAKLINQGQSVFALMGNYQNVDKSFGTAEATSHTEVSTWAELIAAEKTTAGRAELQDYVQKSGVNPNATAAVTTFQVERQETVFRAQWSYGLSAKWMIGARLPLVLTKTRVTPNTELSSDFDSQIQSSYRRQRALSLTNKSLEQHRRDRVRDVVNSQITDKGYSTVTTEERTSRIGDVTLLSQEQIWQNYAARVSLQQILNVPTARSRSLYEVVDSPAGDGQFDFGLMALSDWAAARRLELNARLGYVVQLKDEVTMRTQNSQSSTVSEVRRNLGDYWTAGLKGEYQLGRRWRSGGGYSYYDKAQDQYSGSKLAASEAQALSQDTRQTLHLAHVQLTYQLAQGEGRAGLERQWLAQVSYYRPLAGSHIENSDQARFEIMAYY